MGGIASLSLYIYIYIYRYMFIYICVPRPYTAAYILMLLYKATPRNITQITIHWKTKNAHASCFVPLSKQTTPNEKHQTCIVVNKYRCILEILKAHPRDSLTRVVGISHTAFCFQYLFLMTVYPNWASPRLFIFEILKAHSRDIFTRLIGISR